MSGLVIGQNVPWNAAWSGEERYSLGKCEYAMGMMALQQKQAPGEGKPLFAEPHATRQRKSIAHVLCTVCGVHVKRGERWWFGHGDYHPGEEAWMTTEAPVHHECAVLSMDLCPHLRQRGLLPMPFPAGATVIGAYIKPESLTKLFGLVSDEPVIGHLKYGWKMNAPPTGYRWVIPPLGGHRGALVRSPA